MLIRIEQKASGESDRQNFTDDIAVSELNPLIENLEIRRGEWISSAEIRKAYAVLGRAGDLHPDVESYLKAKGLYGT